MDLKARIEFGARVTKALGLYANQQAIAVFALSEHTHEELVRAGHEVIRLLRSGVGSPADGHAVALLTCAQVAAGKPVVEQAPAEPQVTAPDERLDELERSLLKGRLEDADARMATHERLDALEARVKKLAARKPEPTSSPDPSIDAWLNANRAAPVDAPTTPPSLPESVAVVKPSRSRKPKPETA